MAIDPPNPDDKIWRYMDFAQFVSTRVTGADQFKVLIDLKIHAKEGRILGLECTFQPEIGTFKNNDRLWRGRIAIIWLGRSGI